MDRNPTDMANEVFPAEPDRIALYPASGQQRVLAALQQDVAAGLHLLCLTGPAGCGKTVLLRALRQSFKHGLVGSIEQAAPGRLLFDMAKAFQLDSEDANESSLRRRLVMLLSMASQQQQPIIQIVDAADDLLTEDLNLLLHFFPPGHATLILACRAAPETWLAGCSTSAGAVHIDRSYQLDPLSAEETADYIRHRLRRTELPADLFQPATLAMIHQKSGGVPGRINQYSADALAHADVRREQGGSYTARETAPGAGMSGNSPQASAEGISAADRTTEPVRERRRSADATARPVVAPREARYATEQLPSRTRRLRRSARFWRALAVLSIAALALDLTRDAWLAYIPKELAVFYGRAEPVPQTAGAKPSSQASAQPKALEGPAEPTAPSNRSGASADFAALYAPSMTHENPGSPQSPGTKNDPGIVSPQPAAALPPTPESVRESASGPPVDTAMKSAETVHEDADADGTESAAATPTAPESVPKSGSEPLGDDPKHAAETDPKTASTDSAESGLAREPSRLTRSQRQEIARLYAERAEYEWRNGEPGAAAVSIRRGLSADPTNPRLLHMQDMLRQITQEP